MSSWIDFWNNNHSIYVNNLHKKAHSERLLEDIDEWISNKNFSVLDFGCGEALYAEELAKRCAQLVLVDSSKNMRETLISRTKSVNSISILGLEEFDDLSNSSFELIIVNSVFQYMQLDETQTTLRKLSSKLKSNGKLIIADVIPPDLSMVSDVISLLKFGLRNGFFFMSLVGMLKTFFSNYTSLRREVGLSVYSIEDFTNLLIQNGFEVKLMPRNFGHNQSRKCFCATKNH